MRNPPVWLRALGSAELPGAFEIDGKSYRRVREFKHDFFAATGCYEGDAGRVVLKMGRRASLFGVPMQWIGIFLARREARFLRLFGGVEGIPRCMGIWSETGLVHEYVEGQPLDRRAAVDDRFFPRLAGMLKEIHARGAAYVDLEKPENILLGVDGRPYLFDFQIAWHVPENRGGRSAACRVILSILQESDRYHLYKHWRRLRPDQLSTSQVAELCHPPFWIRWHRAVFRPVTVARRQILVWLGAREKRQGRSPG